MAKGFSKGNAGKPKGAQNKTTKRAKELVVELVEAGLPDALNKLKSIKDPKEYLDALSKFISYVVPKQTVIESTVHLESAIIDWSEDNKTNE